MLQDPNVERYVQERIEPLQEQIKDLQAEMFKLMQSKNTQNVSKERELLIAFYSDLKEQVGTYRIESIEAEKAADAFLKNNL